MTYTLRVAIPHKSVLQVPEDLEFDETTLLTGVNGSGKSHLLEAMNEGHVQVIGDGSPVPIDKIQLFTWSDLEAGSSQPADAISLQRNHRSLWDSYVNERNDTRYTDAFHTLLDSVISRTLSSREFWQISKADLLEIVEGDGERIWTQLENQRSANSTSVLNRLEGRQEQVFRILNAASEQYGKRHFQLSRSEFLSVVIFAGGVLDPFRQNLSELFAIYEKQFNDNVLARARHEQYGEDAPYQTDEAFYVEHGQPPWDFLNSLLELEGYDFRVTRPILSDRDEPFTAMLIHQVHGVEIDFESLSSGERILIALAICIYNTDDDRVRVNYPKLMLFDEVDAPLHPSMIRSMLRIFDDVLVKKHGINVLMTTHSPTTVALADHAQILQINKTDPRIERATQDSAIQFLTSGVTALSVKVENRRPVFVESNNDVEYFEELSSVLKNSLPSDYVPNFLSAGFQTREAASEQGGGKARLKDIVEKLNSCGSEVFGLCDGDMTNTTPEGSLLYLGAGGRYAIENYIFDPLFIAAVIAREQWYTVIPKTELGLNEDSRDTWAGLQNADTADLQTAVDRVLEHIGPPEDDHSVERRAITLENGTQLFLPIWFLQENGHSWTQRVLSKIPQFNRYGNSAHRRIKKMISFIVGPNTGFLDSSFVETLRELHSEDLASR